jgi:hypothetical protein
MSPRSVSRAGTVATVAAALAVIAGLFTLGTPSHARERKLDGLRVNDLSRLAGFIDSYWLKHAELPQSLDSLVTMRLVDRVPTDPESHQPYTYLASGERSYRLCATFAQPSDSTTAVSDENDDIVMSTGTRDGTITHEPHSWRHGVGESCFDLTPPPKDAK